MWMLSLCADVVVVDNNFDGLLQEAAETVQKVVGDKGLDVLINNAGTSEDLVPPLDT